MTALELRPTTPVAPRKSATPAPGLDEVHLWQCASASAALDFSYLRSILSADERDRAMRLRFAETRDDFIRWRGWLRIVLSGYVGCEPRSVRFVYGPNGKPALHDSGVAGNLRFNLSHTDGFAICAVTRDREVGVDVERTHPASVEEAAADPHFSEDDRAALQLLSGIMRGDAIAQYWALYAAYAKVGGGNIGDPAPALNVASLCGSQPRMVGTTWVQTLGLPHGYVGALATEAGEQPPFTVYRF